MTREEMEELKGLAASMGLYDDKNPCKRAVILGKAIRALEEQPEWIEAIKHAEEVAGKKEKEGSLNQESFMPLNEFMRYRVECLECAKEHRQLAEWLKDYKRLLEQPPILDEIRAEIKKLSPTPTAEDVIDGNEIKEAVWEILADVLKIIDKYKAESEGKE